MMIPPWIDLFLFRLGLCQRQPLEQLELLTTQVDV